MLGPECLPRVQIMRDNIAAKVDLNAVHNVAVAEHKM
jgi:hypothetical protein